MGANRIGTIPSSKLKEWRELAERATPGPWQVRMGDIVQLTDAGKGYPLDYYPDSIDVVSACVCGNGGWWRERDSLFMAEARSALPQLLDEVDSLRRQLVSAVSLAIKATHGGNWDEEDQRRLEELARECGL